MKLNYKKIFYLFRILSNSYRKQIDFYLICLKIYPIPSKYYLIKKNEKLE